MDSFGRYQRKIPARKDRDDSIGIKCAGFMSPAARNSVFPTCHWGIPGSITEIAPCSVEHRFAVKVGESGRNFSGPGLAKVASPQPHFGARERQNS